MTRADAIMEKAFMCWKYGGGVHTETMAAAMLLLISAWSNTQQEYEKQKAENAEVCDELYTKANAAEKWLAVMFDGVRGIGDWQTAVQKVIEVQDIENQRINIGVIEDWLNEELPEGREEQQPQEQGEHKQPEEQ